MSDGTYTIDVTLDSHPLTVVPNVQVTNGNFLIWVRIPPGTPDGSHQICTTPTSSTGTLCFDIPVCTHKCAPSVGFLQNGMASPSATVLLKNGVTLVGDRFVPREWVSVAMDPPSGPWLNWAWVDGNGRFSVDLSFDSNEPLGAHQIEVTGRDRNGHFTGDDVSANITLVQVINFIV